MKFTECVHILCHSMLNSLCSDMASSNTLPRKPSEDHCSTVLKKKFLLIQGECLPAMLRHSLSAMCNHCIGHHFSCSVSCESEWSLPRYVRSGDKSKCEYSHLNQCYTMMAIF
jgi:hypothetical protein